MTERAHPHQVAIFERQVKNLRDQEAGLLADCFREMTDGEELVFLGRRRVPGRMVTGLEAYTVQKGSTQRVECDLARVAIVHCNGVPYASLTKTSGLRELIARMLPAAAINRNYALHGQFSIEDAAGQYADVAAGVPSYRLWAANGRVVYGAKLRTQERDTYIQARPARLLMTDELPDTNIQLAERLLPKIADQTGDKDPRTISAWLDIVDGDKPQLQRISLKPERINVIHQRSGAAFSKMFIKAEVAAMLGLRQKLMS